MTSEIPRRKKSGGVSMGIQQPMRVAHLNHSSDLRILLQITSNQTEVHPPETQIASKKLQFTSPVSFFGKNTHNCNPNNHVENDRHISDVELQLPTHSCCENSILHFLSNWLASSIKRICDRNRGMRINVYNIH